MDESIRPVLLDELQTPCSLVDIEVITHNAETMIGRCQQYGVKLRPNVKTHKCLEIAKIQTVGTRRCISVSTVREAEFFARGGFDDILLSTIFTHDKIIRLQKLHESLQQFHVLVDSDYGIDMLEKSCQSKPWSAYIKLDCGNHRSGISWDNTDEVVRLARRIQSSQVLTLYGLYVHEGDSYTARGKENILRAGDTAATRLKAVHKCLSDEGVTVPELAVGSTPTCSWPSDVTKTFTEFHPGNYIFYDVQQTIIGSCSLQDVGLKIATRVKGHFPQRNQLLVDAGFTALSHDGQQARAEMDNSLCVVEGHPDLRLVKTNQEVGFIEGKHGPINYSAYPIGSLLFLLPYHSCATACQHRCYYVVNGQSVVDVWQTCNGW